MSTMAFVLKSFGPSPDPKDYLIAMVFRTMNAAFVLLGFCIVAVPPPPDFKHLQLTCASRLCRSRALARSLRNTEQSVAQFDENSMNVSFFARLHPSRYRAAR